MPLDDQEQRAVVFLTKRVRDQLHGARKWDEAGIAAAISKVAKLHIADVILAATRAADDRTLETPAPIGNARAHCWRERATDRPVPVEPFNPSNVCGVCSQPRHRCEANTHSGHTYVSTNDVRRNARRNQENP